MIVVFGSVNVDFLFRLDRLPTPGQTLMAHGMATQPGGKGANQAVAAAQDGATVAMVGATGTDALAETGLAGLRAAGVALASVRAVPDLPTGCAAIHTDAAGRNQIVVAPGANAAASARQLTQAHLQPGTILLLQMEVQAAEVEAAIAAGHRAGCRIILNLAPALPLGRDSLARLELLVVNEDEAEFLAETLGTTPDAAALHAALGIGVVRTLGAAGAEAMGAHRPVRVPAPAIAARDTTAAGDCFLGVLAAALDRGAPLAAAMERAAAAAALACERPGSQASIPHRTEIDAALHRFAPG